MACIYHCHSYKQGGVGVMGYKQNPNCCDAPIPAFDRRTVLGQQPISSLTVLGQLYTSNKVFVQIQIHRFLSSLFDGGFLVIPGVWYTFLRKRNILMFTASSISALINEIKSLLALINKWLYNKHMAQPNTTTAQIKAKVRVRRDPCMLLITQSGKVHSTTFCPNKSGTTARKQACVPHYVFLQFHNQKYRLTWRGLAGYSFTCENDEISTAC